MKNNMKKVVLLADKNSRAWDFALKIKNYIFHHWEEIIPLYELQIEHFRNGEIKMYVPENLRKKEVYFIHNSIKNPQEWLVEIILLKDLLLSASVESISFVFPDMMYSRQDRKDKPHVPISARAVANTICYPSKPKRIITMDLHASQIQGMYPEDVPLDNLRSFPEIIRYLKETNLIPNLKELVVVSPDAGGVGRARAFAQKIGSKNPIAFIEKRRASPGEIAEMRLSGNVEGKNIIIVDDMIDSGGTLSKASKLLKEKGAQKMYCYGTHGLFTEGTTELCECFERVITSNTHYQQDENIDIIDVSALFAEAIYRAQKGLSISKLFE